MSKSIAQIKTQMPQFFAVAYFAAFLCQSYIQIIFQKRQFDAFGWLLLLSKSIAQTKT